ncbi:MAG TPA: Uma2 family endonuclease [Ktedonobacteraceae bacterium]|nr:Uma2 family endonuclease [Ktedonobacteraceae bacterium]
MVANLQDNDPHGLPMSERDFERLVDAEDIPRYELIDGVVYDMTGSSEEHGQAAGNIFSLVHNHLRGKGSCRVYQDQFVKVPNRPSSVPDVVVTCNRLDWDKDKKLKPFKIQYPRIIVEVLSPSTEKFDRKEKFSRYRCCLSLEVYILVHQDEMLIEVYRKSTGWKKERFIEGQMITLDQIGLDLSVDEIYEGVF